MFKVSYVELSEEVLNENVNFPEYGVNNPSGKLSIFNVTDPTPSLITDCLKKLPNLSSIKAV